jgi:methyltransferase (TIGR00027 family)
MTTPSLENRLTSAMPSRTCLLVAAARAFGSREPDESLRNPDLLADQLIGPAELALISGHPLSQMREREYAKAAQDPTIVFFVWAMLARTRFIDEALRRAVENGAKQIVILGAGLDTRAYRFRELLQQCRVIEVDAEQTQQYKKQRLCAAKVDVPPNLTYARCDFACDSLGEVLRSAGYNAGEKTFYIWEGVCMYLTEESVRRTLRTIAAESASGSSLVLDYANRIGIEIGSKYPQGASAIAAVWGEPWLFGVPGGTDGRDFFRELGLDPGDPISFSNHEKIIRYTSGEGGRMYGAALFQKLQEEAQARAKAGDTSPGPLMPELTDEQKEVWRTGAHWLAELTVRPATQP